MAMLNRLHQQLVVRPQDVAASSDDMEVIGTFNPGAAEHGDEVLILVRVAERTREQRPGYVALPRWSDGRVVVDWMPEDQVELLDPRVVQRKEDGLLRLTFTSHLRVVRSRDGRTADRFDGPTFVPQMPWEEYGVEDPRIVALDGRYWITYVAVSRHGAATALASTADFQTFQRHGIIFCPENKDVVLFPEKVGGQYAALHRPTTAHPFCRPEIWFARSPDLLHWGDHQVVHGGSSSWESGRVGAGVPPIRTEQGWLEIYHASRRSTEPGKVGTYVGGIMLLDLENPALVKAYRPEPLWEPDQSYELEGFVPGVVFPTAVVSRGDRLQMYYGAADTYTAMVEFDRAELLSAA